MRLLAAGLLLACLAIAQTRPPEPVAVNLTQIFAGEHIHNWARPAPTARCCVYREDQPKFWNLAAPSLSPTGKSLAEGRAIEVNPTPNLWVSGRKLQGNVSWPQLRQMIKSKVENRKTVKNAGENCGCELTLPSVLPK